ncbi:MAG TPA: ABC transporter permease [Dongiaceae bacterium]
MTHGQQILKRPVDAPVNAAASTVQPQRLLFNVGLSEQKGHQPATLPRAGRSAVLSRALIRGRRWSDLGRAVSRRSNVLLSLSVPLALLIAWQLSSLFGWLPEQILPAPQVVWQTLLDYAADGSLASDTSISLLRVLRGFTSGAAIGLALGGVLASSPRLRAYLDPLFLAVSQVPILGWVPLLILLIGIDEGLKTSLVALSIFIPVTLGTYQGIRDVPQAYREVGQVLTFGRHQMLGTIILPAAVPAIFTGLREGLSNGWQTLVAVELLASTEGLGYQMAYGRQLFQLELVITAMLIIGLIGFSFDFLLGRIERYLQRWQVTA